MPQVRSFRGEKLGGVPLEPVQVDRFLRRELLYLPSGEYAQLELYLQNASYSDYDDLTELKALVGGQSNRSLKTPLSYQPENFDRVAEFDSIGRRLTSQPGIPCRDSCI